MSWFPFNSHTRCRHHPGCRFAEPSRKAEAVFAGSKPARMRGQGSPETRGCAARLGARAGLRGAVLPGTETRCIARCCFSSPTSTILVQEFRSCAVADSSAATLVPKSRQQSLLFQGQLFQGPGLQRDTGTGTTACASCSAGEGPRLGREDRVRLPETGSLLPFLFFLRPAR